VGDGRGGKKFFFWPHRGGGKKREKEKLATHHRRGKKKKKASSHPPVRQFQGDGKKRGKRERERSIAALQDDSHWEKGENSSHHLRSSLVPCRLPDRKGDKGKKREKRTCRPLPL